MKSSLFSLLMMFSFSLCCSSVSLAADGETVTPASLSVGEPLELYSYTILGIEGRAFTDEEFVEYRRRLAPVPRPRKGVTTMNAGELAFLRHKQGLLITRVIPGSPAEAAGICENEVLLNIGGAQMNSPADLLVVLRNCSPGIPMHMRLIGNDLRWRDVRAVPVARPEPTQVGHIVPLSLSKENTWKMQKHQAEAIRLLAMEPVPMKEACDELEAVCRMIYKGYTPGCLRLPLRSGACSIAATRNGWNIEVQMQENGIETHCTLRHYEGPHVLPDAIRRRLQEIDCSGIKPPSRWDEEINP